MGIMEIIMNKNIIVLSRNKTIPGMMYMNTYLITGGAGFIGSNFIKYILNKYENIKIICLDKLTYAGNLATIENELESESNRLEFIKGDINNRELLEYIFETGNITCIINFAAETHVDRSIENDTGLFLESNILGVKNLMNTAKKKWQTREGHYPESVKFLQISTDEVYGSLKKEGYFTEKDSLEPNNPYAASKAGADLLIRSYYNTYNFPALITRSSNNYGPYQYPEKLMPLMINNIFQGKKLPIYGDGSHIRDWLHVKDHCRALEMVLKKGRPGEIYNIGSHNEKTNLEVVETLIKKTHNIIQESKTYKNIINTDLNHIDKDLINFVKDRAGHDKRYALDYTKIKNEIGWEPKIRFEDGIIDVIKWYLEHQEWLQVI